MSKLVMDKRASDNVYFHPDFHIAMNLLIDYLEKNYGKKAIKEYLKQFSLAYFKPLKEKIKKKGLKPLKKYIEDLYKKEGGKIDLKFTKDLLVVKIKRCPAVMHIKKKVPVAESFFETTRTIYQTIVEETPFTFEMKSYDKKTGKTTLIFRRKK